MFQYNRNLLHTTETTYIPPVPVTAAGIYWSSWLWLITLSDGAWVLITIADKNLGANAVWNPWDAYTIANTGNVFQWWNNYAFPSPLDSTPITTSSSKVDASTYWPGNYYYDSTFRTGYIWMNAMNKDLWGETTGTDAARQWPCASGFHIPSKDEFQNLISKWNAVHQYIGWRFEEDFKLPIHGARNANWSASTSTTSAAYWTTSVFSDYYGMYAPINSTSAYPSMNTYHYTTFGDYIRPFKNDPVTPDSNWAIIYQPSS